MREKPGFPAHSSVSSGARPNAGMPGWRRSHVRTGLQPNSLQTGNFSGNSAKFSPENITTMRETPQSQRFLSRFPAEMIRENILKNRDFGTQNREIGWRRGEGSISKRHQNRPRLPKLAPVAGGSRKTGGLSPTLPPIGDPRPLGLALKLPLVAGSQ
ncbi:hypothetical protein V1283_002718 [Bradyrhizobium sp. AZCC 2262]|uniref:hypothetical protein n=1 Tax=Bradyrhizobium sp. AZCC 2262 TaxID=3117022 RepID=UPI002FF0A4B5